MLPKDIISFLHSIDPTHQYYRKGSMRSVDSVIDVLLYARKSDYEELSTSEKNKSIRNIKDKIIQLIKNNNISMYRK